MSDTAIRSRRIAANGLEFDIDEAGEGDSVALFLHGFPEARISWRGQLPLLAQLGWRAVAPDLRGYGGSSRPKGRQAYHLDHLVADVVGIYDALGARRRLLIAHDWGAVIAWVVAAKRAVDLSGLIVMSAPHPRAYRQVLARSWDQRAKSWYVLFFQMPGLPEWAMTRKRGEAVVASVTQQVNDASKLDPELLATFRSNILIPGAATAMINYYRANGEMMGDAGLDRPIDAPTLAIWGEKDAFLAVETARACAPYARDFTLEVLPGVSHWVQQDAPAEVNTRLEAWMRMKGLAAH